MSAGVAASEVGAVPRARGPLDLALRRLRRDRVAVASGIFVLVLLFVVFAGGPILARAMGHGPNDLFPYAVGQYNLKPVGPLTRVPAVHILAPGTAPPQGAPTTVLVLGADGPLGRDELLRLLYGGQVSLEVAIAATVLALLIGVLLGSTAAYFGGWVDAVISRFTDLVMSFPLLLFVIMLGSTVAPRIDGVTLHGVLARGVFSIALLIGLFTWFYPARIVRAQILSLRGREFVEAAAMTGSSDARIIRKHLLPHLGPPLVVYATLMLATNIMLEAGITFLGVGIKVPTSSWGSLLASSWGTVLNPTQYRPANFQPWLTILPSAAIFLTVLSLNQLGEGLRHAFDPRGLL